MLHDGMTWKGEPKIILGIDIGTTQSAVSYILLFKDVVPEIRRISKWPGQGKHEEGSKIPTQIYYDQDGEAVKCGAETTTRDAEVDAEENNWVLAKHFKLHLHPETMKARHNLQAEPLPEGVSLRQIYTDFMVYLLGHTRAYIRNYETDGAHTWAKYWPSMDIAIAHPNGWGVKEQGFLRDTAVAAGFCSHQNSTKQIHFVSEAEASIYHCLEYANFDVLKPGLEFVVCDAGGSTVDTTTYGTIATQPRLSLEEKKVSSCIQAGGIFVDASARRYLTDTLRKAAIDSETLEEYVNTGVEEFESRTKRLFNDSTKPTPIKIADRRFSDPDAGVLRGRINIPGETMKSFHDGPINDILSALEDQLSGLSAKHILLVGGFGESQYLRECIEDKFNAQGVKLHFVDDGKSKPVADGAAIWLVKSLNIQLVSKRAVRFAFGVEVLEPYIEHYPGHRDRPVVTTPAGRHVDGGWSQIVSKGEILEVGNAKRNPYHFAYNSPNEKFGICQAKIYAYSPKDGKPSVPDMLMDIHGIPNQGFMHVCTVSADLSGMRGALVQRGGQSGSYWALDFDIALEFGGTELKASLEWKERGELRTGPVMVIPTAFD